MHRISLPLTVKVSKSRDFHLNLNQYRNTHFHVLNKAKHVFKDEISSDLARLPVFKKVSLVYRIHPKTARTFDLANVGSVVDKFFSDALVETGHLQDDNYKYLIQVTFAFGCVDKERPRAEVEITELE